MMQITVFRYINLVFYALVSALIIILISDTGKVSSIISNGITLYQKLEITVNKSGIFDNSVGQLLPFQSIFHFITGLSISHICSSLLVSHHKRQIKHSFFILHLRSQ